jgi:serine/threonine protein kinase/tetratricopeptide (TPR) repeat protein
VTAPREARKKNGSDEDPQTSTRSALTPSLEATQLAQSGGSAADPFIGRVVSHYRLDERLGTGGMGVLYRASDLSLGRTVAIKFLSQQLARDGVAKARFAREARAASALDHQNIATVYDIGDENGELFIVMALYEGQTLKQRLENGPLPVEEALAVLRQVALGLEAAHRVGIVHRDVKPANVLVTSSGALKILDFGLAKHASDAAMTEAGQTMGTVLYMSPEQLRGQPVDARTDLWSLGVLAYELLSGISPFRAESNEATAMRILNDEPPPLTSVPGVPAWLVELVAQLLRKEPANRPQSASEVLRTLDRSGKLRNRAAPTEVDAMHSSHRIRRMVIGALIGAIVLIGSAGLYLRSQRRETRNQSGAVKSLVVLPFLNVSANADTEYLSDGIAESLIDNLSQIPELRVTARNTAFRYKGKDVDLQKLGRELSADAVLTGRFQQRGDTLVVHADLVNLGTGSQLWGEKYNKKVTDLLTVEEDIAKAISDKLRPRLTAEVQHRVTRQNTENAQAYQLYLRGRYFWNKRTKEGLNKGVEYFQQAIELDPNYALAYAGLADSYSLLAHYLYAPWKQNLARAEAAALKALALNDELAEAHAALGNISMNNWDWLAAETHLKRAIALNPNYATAHNWYGLYLNWMGHLEQAAAEFTRAQQLDPASAVFSANMGSILCQMRQYQRGIEQLKEALQLEPNYSFIHVLLASVCYIPQQKYQESLDQLKQAVTLNPANPVFLASLGWAYGLAGEKDRAVTILKELKRREESEDMATAIAQVYMGLGDKDRAFEWAEKAYQRHSSELASLSIAACNDEIRSDPRFVDLFRRLGLPPQR